MLLSVVESIWSFLKQTINNGLTPDVIFYMGLGFIALMVLFFIIKTYFSYENKLDRHLEKFNRWLYVHQNISEKNLIEFNNMMRKAPKLLRYHWQQYILYREDSPSHYMSVYNCIEKPLHTSSYTANIKNFTMITVVSSIVVFIMSLLNYVGSGGLAGGSSLSVSNITLSLIAPIIMLILATIFIIVLRTKQNLDLSSLYQNFHLFTRSIDKAATSIPKYVDFEVLFTPKEIKNGIPILGEYLEKRARQEAEELEQARLNAGKIEEYDFSSSGIDGSVMLDRAMKETEIYLNARSRLYAEIQQYETEIRSLDKNYENVTRDYQKKLQASKESLERLRIQQEESTNRIESNYIVKQQQNEIKKQEQLEKDQEDATTRYNQEVRVYKEEIVKRQNELDEKKNNIQNVMLSEYQTFSNKVYQTVLNDIKDDANSKLQELARQKESVEKDLATQKEISNIKDEVIEELKQALTQLKNQSAQDSNQQIEEQSVEDVQTQQETDSIEPIEVSSQLETPVETAEQQEEISEDAVEGYYDENGYYWYPNGTYYDDKGLYHDEYGNIYDSEGNLIELANEQQQELAQDDKEKNLDEISESPVAVETQVDEQEDVEKEQPEEMAEQKEFVQQMPIESEITETQASEQSELIAQNEDDKPKRKVGRPKKQSVDNAEDKPKRKAGRPKKEKPIGEEDAPKRKVGRPRKEKPEEEQNKPKRSVGRPRKEKAQEDVKPKRKVGRPRKEKLQDEQDGPKRKVGRPKKSSEEKLNEKINEESQKLEQEERELLKTLGSTLKKLADNSEPESK